MTLRSLWFPILFWTIVVLCGAYVVQREHVATSAMLTTQAEDALTRELQQIDLALSNRPASLDDERRFRQVFLPALGPGSDYFLVNRRYVVTASDQAGAEGQQTNALFDDRISSALRQIGQRGGSVVGIAGNNLYGVLSLHGAIGDRTGTLLLIRQDLSSTRAYLTDRRDDALITFAVLAMAGVILTFTLLVRGMNQRLQRIRRAVRRFADGDGTARANLVGHDPIARLAGLFDNMANRIGEERSNLAESEERLKFALHGSNAGIWDWDIESGHTYYSPRWKSLLGFDEHELQAHSEEWLKRVHPDDLPRVLSLLNAHMTGANACFESEHRLLRKDNIYIWVLERGVVLRDGEGKPYRMVGALTDITRRKEVESALQRSEEAYRSVVNAVTQVIFRCDDQGRLTFLNPAWTDLTGNPADASLSHPLMDFVYGEDRDHATKLVARAARGNQDTVSCELRLTTRAGGKRWFSLHARSILDDHGVPGIAGLLTDIDPLKKAQDALTQSNKERNTILDLSPDGYVFIDRDHKVVYVNPAFLAMTGMRADHVLGNSQDELEARLHTLCDPAKPLPQFAATADDDENLLYLTSPAKSILKWLIRHIRDHQGVLQAGVIFFRDVTAQVEIDRMKSEFLSTAAHELRTPMASIYGFAELLLAREFDAPTQRDLIQRIHRQTKNLTNLVNELLDLARIEARGSKSFKLKDYALAPLVMNSLGTFYVPHETHNLEIDLPADLPTVHVDADKFHQALINVLSNALKYSPDGGTIQVRSTRQREDGKDYVGIIVEDEGIGMTPEQMAHIFDRFYRADTSGAIPGTGLGMCLVKEIMGFLSGHVSVDSTLGKGSEVTLWLPCVPAAPNAG